jgi:inner membrane protein involved in colicin E2 resistance
MTMIKYSFVLIILALIKRISSYGKKMKIKYLKNFDNPEPDTEDENQYQSKNLNFLQLIEKDIGQKVTRDMETTLFPEGPYTANIKNQSKSVKIIARNTAKVNTIPDSELTKGSNSQVDIKTLSVNSSIGENADNRLSNEESKMESPQQNSERAKDVPFFKINLSIKPSLEETKGRKSEINQEIKKDFLPLEPILKENSSEGEKIEEHFVNQDDKKINTQLVREAVVNIDTNKFL